MEDSLIDDISPVWTDERCNSVRLKELIMNVCIVSVKYLCYWLSIWNANSTKTAYFFLFILKLFDLNYSFLLVVFNVIG